MADFDFLESTIKSFLLYSNINTEDFSNSFNFKIKFLLLIMAHSIN